MSAPVTVLHGFAYGEHLDGPQQRSLGFRLLTPTEPTAWSAEVEALARGLQGAPFPDPWPPADLFCSVLLADGQRLVAVARYGLADHTPSRRRSGLELIGIVGPASLGVASALAIYRWLKQQRACCEDLRTLGATHALDEVLAAVPPQAPANESLPVLPIRLWQEGTLLFAATAPTDPDRRLGLLEQGTASNWQWLPLVGGDFPLGSYGPRGPLIAWTPHLAGVALKLDTRATEPQPLPSSRRALGVAVAALLLISLCLGFLLWQVHALSRQIASLPTNEAKPAVPIRASAATTPASDPADRERFVVAVYRLLEKRGALTDKDRARLMSVYEGLLAEDEALRVMSPDGKAAVGLLEVLSRRGPGQVEAVVRESLTGKGYDPELVNRACLLIRERLSSDSRAPR